MRKQIVIALKSPEFYMSLVVSAATWIVISASGTLQESTQLPTVLVGYSALGLAVTAVVLTALAILVASLGEDHYSEILERAGGVDEAIAPFVHVAYVSGGTVVAGIAGLFVWEQSVWARPGAFAIPTFFAVWSVLGAVSLVGLVGFHGEMRSDLNVSIRRSRNQIATLRDDQKHKRASGE